MLFVNSPLHAIAVIQSQTSSCSLQKEMAGAVGALDKERSCTKGSSKRRLRPKTCVRFNGVTAVWSAPHSAQTSNDQDTNTSELPSQWYTKAEYAQFRTALVAEAKEAIRSHKAKESKTKSGVSSIRRAYEMITASTCFSSQDDSSFSSEDDNSVECSFPELDLPCHGCSDFVGLEQLVTKKSHRDKHRRRCMLWHAVLEIQQEQQQSHDSCSSKDLQASILRRVCEEISGPSKKFALYLGMASSAPETTVFVSI
ncbi:hypothetical protein ACA910_009866 [Epithemia clementina (nom. ined.)]